jgi:hypothetical protein
VRGDENLVRKGNAEVLDMVLNQIGSPDEVDILVNSAEVIPFR